MFNSWDYLVAKTLNITSGHCVERFAFSIFNNADNKGPVKKEKNNLTDHSLSKCRILICLLLE